MIGIYKFENLINGHKYIGQSVDIERRYKDHIMRATNDFSSNSEYNSILHQAIRKYGIENFSFEIIEQCSKKDLDKKEIYWIQYYNSFHNGCNTFLFTDEFFWSMIYASVKDSAIPLRFISLV